jgi:DGQHR domain-containing protein
MNGVGIPVFSVRQPIGEFHVGVVRADDLLRICEFDYRRMHYTGGYIDYLGIQRKLDQKRVHEIAQYVKTIDACFPTSIVISVDEKCARIEPTDREGFNFLRIFAYEDPVSSELSVPLDHVATIIDGQHRLMGLKEADKLDFELPLSVFVGIDDATEASMFSTVNLSQTKVNKSLVFDLFSLAKSRSPEKTCHEIVVNLDRLSDSPFQGKIKRLGVATEGRFGETLSQATVVKGLLPYISDDPLFDRDIGKRMGFWEPLLAGDVKRRIFYEFFRRNEDEKILHNVVNYFNAIKERWPTAWSGTGTGNIINRTNGFNAFVRFLRPAYLYCTTTPTIVSKDQFKKIFDRVRLNDEDFNPTNFLPGSSGASTLYRRLLDDSQIAQ